MNTNHTKPLNRHEAVQVICNIPGAPLIQQGIIRECSEQIIEALIKANLLKED